MTCIFRRWSSLNSTDCGGLQQVANGTVTCCLRKEELIVLQTPMEEKPVCDSGAALAPACLLAFHLCSPWSGSYGPVHKDGEDQT